MVVAVLIVGLALGLAVGGCAVWLVMRERVRAERRARDELSGTFAGLSAQALQSSTTSFLELAETKLAPLRDSLVQFDDHVRALERSRHQAYGELNERVRLLTTAQELLRRETSSLVKALRAPATRGQWGELQLRRTLELAGMLRHCDFVEQPTASADDRILRPDVVVRLPGGKNVVIDSKVPLEALLDAFESEAEHDRARRLDDFVRNVREHMTKLSAKAYWQQFAPAPEFVVMFLASESFYRHAIEHDETLLELGPRQRVILASPTTLIALLMAAAAGWREETLAESARQISEHGRELYERLSTMGGHFARLGSRLDRAVEAYNDAIGSLESRVLVTARRLPELGIAAKAELPEMPSIERSVKPVTALELLDARDADAA
jgi:DNA recombination protein RmuC